MLHGEYVDRGLAVRRSDRLRPETRCERWRYSANYGSVAFGITAVDVPCMFHAAAVKSWRLTC